MLRLQLVFVVSFQARIFFTFKRLIIYIFLDTEKPTIDDVPQNIVQSTDPGSNSAVVSWPKPLARDNSGYVTLSTSHEPGDSFPIGETTVSFTAIDPYSNKATKSFTVTVRGKLQSNDPDIQLVQFSLSNKSYGDRFLEISASER